LNGSLLYPVVGGAGSTQLNGERLPLIFFILFFFKNASSPLRTAKTNTTLLRQLNLRVDDCQP